VLEGKCSCGAARIALAKPPKYRFYCHCTICQSVYRAPFSDAMFINAKAVTVETPNALYFKRYRPGQALERGRCTTCDDPVIAMADLPFNAQLAFVPARIFDDQDQLPEAAVHIHYGTRQADIDDDLPKRNSPFASQMALTGPLIRALVAG
jgi:hypothetical protein